MTENPADIPCESEKHYSHLSGVSAYKLITVPEQKTLYAGLKLV